MVFYFCHKYIPDSRNVNLQDKMVIFSSGKTVVIVDG